MNIRQPFLWTAVCVGILTLAPALHAGSSTARESPDGTPLPPSSSADFTGDGVVDDNDFAMFISQYNVMLCNEPGMPDNCVADLNHDGQVDDADFVLFSDAYKKFTSNIS